MLNRYLEFKCFELFRDKLAPLVEAHNSSEKGLSDIYSHIFLSPPSTANQRSFQVTGAQYPFVALWSGSPLEYSDDIYYARSTLPRYVSYEDADKCLHYTSGYLYDYTKPLTLTAGSYFKDFVDDVNQNLLELDRLRYFKINMSELLPGFESTIELELTNASFSEDTSVKNRKFTLQTDYSLKASLFIARDFPYIERIRVYLQENIIYQK